jgi:hypothetical protein
MIFGLLSEPGRTGAEPVDALGSKDLDIYVHQLTAT